MNNTEEEYDENENENKNKFNYAEILNDNNVEFVFFKTILKKWTEIDDDIITLQNVIKQKKKEKENMTPKIMDFMNRYDINDLNTQTGKIKCIKSIQKKPMNKNYLTFNLSTFLKDNQKAEEVTEFLLGNRGLEEKCRLKRVANKNELNI
jgi:hypothetical protein